MKIDPKVIEILKKEETQKLILSVATEVVPEMIKGTPAFIKSSVKTVKNTVGSGVKLAKGSYESINHERLFFKKLKEKVIPFPSNYSRKQLKEYLSQSSNYIKHKTFIQENEKEKLKFEEYNKLHKLLELTIQKSDYEEYIKLYISNDNDTQYFVGSELLKEDFINIKHDYKKVISFLFNVVDETKTHEDIMREIAKEKPTTNI